MKHRKKALATLVAAAMGGALALPTAAYSQTTEQLMQQIQAIQAQLAALQNQVTQQAATTQKASATADAASKEASEAKTSVAKVFERIPIPKREDSYQSGTVNMHTGESNPEVGDSTNFLQRVRDDSLSFKMPGGGGLTLYGNLDVSVDDVTNGLNRISTAGVGNSPYGNNGYLAAISGNSTNIGLRGFQPIGGWKDTQFLWQAQVNFGVTTNPATKLTNSNQSNAVAGTLGSGTSYIGLGSKTWGSVKVGKTYAPYALATNVFNPFAGQLGSMNVVMGNTGGDNRVEFGTPLDHSIWYGSPNWNGLSFAALFSPGQNRAVDSSAIPQGESDCAGGNIPGSGGSLAPDGVTTGCNDGAFSNVFSASLVYDDKQAWYLTGAYELHQNVNRSSDLAPGTFGYTAAQLVSMDTARESAAKIGAMYRFKSTGTTVGVLYETMKRNVPSALSYQNERQRHGTWFVIEQKLPGANQLNFGWAHAGTALGDPGAHNDGNIAGFPGNTPNNSANMYTLALIHQVDRNLSFYVDYAQTVNGPASHYDLGAGGHGGTTDCHDSGGPIPANGGITGSPECWAGANLRGISVGARYRF